MKFIVTKNLGGYGSDLDAFAGLQTYRKMVLESAGKSSLECESRTLVAKSQSMDLL